MRCRIYPIVFAVMVPSAAAGQSGTADEAGRIRSALSAAPASVAAGAAVVDLDGTVLREGSSSWVCMPDNPAQANDSPMCLDAQWREFLEAYMARRQPAFRGIGFGYMLQGDFPVSNTDPFATGPTPDNQWVADSGPHVMMIVSDAALLEDLPTDPANGGPWVMWKGTPYEHVMIPAVARSR
jgi:hypothetical protein